LESSVVQDARKESSMKNSLAPTSVYMTTERRLRGEQGENEERILKAAPSMQTNLDNIADFETRST